MIILTIRTDKPESEIALYTDDTQLGQIAWEAHRQLADTIHLKIEQLLTEQAKTWQDITGVVVYQGPGSFTGLRIGITVANALALGLQVPVVASQTDDWQAAGIARIVRGENDHVVVPFYGAEANITAPKK